MIEQRKNQRFDLRLPFELVGAKSRSPKGETMNLSSCGVLFTASGAMEVGESIEYLITLPKVSGTRADVRLRCVGKVVRRDDAAPSEEAMNSEAPVSAFAATLERYEFVRAKV